MSIDTRAVLEHIQQLLLANPLAAGWPEVVSLIKRSVAADASPCWEYPLFAARAAGGSETDGIPAAASIFCLLQSIHLVDDIIDDDPGGLYHRLGAGNTANLGLAFQALAATVLTGRPVSPWRAAEAQDCVAQIALETAAGQRLDALEITDEAGYWRAALAKTPPLFGGALKLGALLAGGTADTCGQVMALGQPIGKIVQLSDDLRDAMQVPVSADWQGRGNNLAILYARIADHPEQQRFIDLLPQVGETAEALVQAQEILVRSGAVSYCAFHMIETYRTAMTDLKAAGLPDFEPLADLLGHLVLPLQSLLEAVGVESPAELFSS